MNIYLFLLLLGSSYDNEQAQKDSLFIYNTYKHSFTVLQNSDVPEKWYAYEDSLSQLTACHFLRLSQFNKQPYRPVDELNKEGFGVAFLFPEPGVPDDEDADEPLVVTNTQSEEEEEEDEVEKSEEPQQHEVVSESKDVDSAVQAKEIAFKVLDRQTRFLVSANGKTKTPYVIMNYYAKGRILVKTEKLDPINFLPLKVDNSGLLISSN